MLGILFFLFNLLRKQKVCSHKQPIVGRISFTFTTQKRFFSQEIAFTLLKYKTQKTGISRIRFGRGCVTKHILDPN